SSIVTATSLIYTLSLHDALPIFARYPEVEEITHVHHAGNSSGIVDGASAVLVGNLETGKAMGLKPRARIRAMGSIGSEPCIMLRSEEHTSELQSRENLVCRLLLE